MKISELRVLLDQTSTEDLKRILVEVYRVLPKKTRENLAIDELLKNPSGSRAGAKQAKAPGHCVDIDKLEAELEQFLSDAYAQNYLAPNLYVPKSQRPKWRFKVKRFFEEINAAVVQPGSIERASDLLEKLYQMLCYACHFVLFQLSARRNCTANPILHLARNRHTIALTASTDWRRSACLVNFPDTIELIVHFQTGFCHFHGFINIGFQDGFHLNYFSNIGEPDLAPRLRILPGFD